MKSFDGSRWICAICGQGFTRKTSAKRHNNNLHPTGAMIVRTIEYIIGRLNSKFPVPPDPLSYRRNSKSWMNSLSPTLSKPILDVREDERYYGNVPQQPKVNDNKNQLYLDSASQNTTKLHKLKETSRYKSSGSLAKLIETKLKVEELKKLLYRYHPAWKASQLLEYVLYLVGQGDHDFLDERLTWLRNIDRAHRDSE
jgi:hypothetical protein